MNAPTLDARADQIERAATYLESHPHSTGPEIDAASDLGCWSKVLSEMQRKGFVFHRDWRKVPTRAGRLRNKRTYTLLSRPRPTTRDLFDEPPPHQA